LSSGDIDATMWVRLLECHNLVLAELRKSFEGECTLARFDLVANLEREDGLTLAELSRRMLVTAGNITGLVDRAERDGVVARRPDASDRRLVRVHLTARGQRLARELIPAHAARLSTLFKGLDRGERRELRRLAGKLRDSLGEAS
jgi:DNA-binding MarR family transcriptional regulator